MSELAIDDEVHVIAGRYKGTKAIVKRILPVMVKIKLSSHQGKIVNVMPTSVLKVERRTTITGNESEVDLLIKQIKRMNLNEKERGKLIKALVEDLDK